MAPRIRRDGKRIRGSDGLRTRNQDCCCVETVACTECLDDLAAQNYLLSITNAERDPTGDIFCGDELADCSTLVGDYELAYTGSVSGRASLCGGSTSCVWQLVTAPIHICTSGSGDDVYVDTFRLKFFSSGEVCVDIIGSFGIGATLASSTYTSGDIPCLESIDLTQATSSFHCMNITATLTPV